jgi:hypothetical protein
MALNNWDCRHCNGTGWRGNEDGRLVPCCLLPVPEWQQRETVEVPMLTEEMVLAKMEGKR